MACRIEVANIVSDARGQARKKQFGRREIRKVQVVDSYLVDRKLKPEELKKAAEALTNPILEQYSVGRPYAPRKFDWAIEIGFLPGVTDNVGTTAKETIEDLLKKKFKPGEQVYYSQIFFIEGKLKGPEVMSLADSLYNPLIQRAQILSEREFKTRKGFAADPPKVILRPGKPVSEINLDLPDDELAELGKSGIENEDGSRRGPLALNLNYLKTIKRYFQGKGRHPTDIEIESLAQTWSEHCKHTIFANPIDEIKDGVYRHYIKRATEEIRRKKGRKDFCVSVFSDNSGAIRFDDKYLITDKVETHNTPSALDPFGGAVTGIVGVNRDTIGFGMGAKPIANVYGFCLADPTDKNPLYRDEARTMKMMPPARIMEGVVAGVNSGGNCSGIPTAQGFIRFDRSYRGKPLVFAGTIGLIPAKIGSGFSHQKGAKPGDYIVMVGGRVGQDGIHGATFSSAAMDEGSPATAVQIGDPITQKKMSDALVKEARDRNLYRSITDDGAGGLSCSVSEMAKESGGCRVDLRKVPLKYPGLEPWKIWISESQERMTLAVPKSKWKIFSGLMKKRGVEASIVGEFTDSGRCIVNYGPKKIMDVELEFLHNGLPQEQQTSREFSVRHPEPDRETKIGATDAARRMLARPNIASMEFISGQYDHEVQASSVLKPTEGRGRVGGSAAVIRPVLSSDRGIVMSQALCPEYSKISAYHMAAAAIDTAVRNAVSVGGDIDYLALLDNFCWSSSDDPERLYELKEAARACYEYAVAYGTPFISGKDSMFNDFSGYDKDGNHIKISVLPTLLISTIGVVSDIKKTVSMDLKFSGDYLYVLGETHDELGESEYARMMDPSGTKTGNEVPRTNAQKNAVLYRRFRQAVRDELVSASASVACGGLGTALIKMAMAGKLGIDVTLDKIPGAWTSGESALWSESQGRITVAVSPAKSKRFEKTMAGLPFVRIGKVTSGDFMNIKSGKDKIKLGVDEALKIYRSTFGKY